jgi:response regulator NasT
VAGPATVRVVVRVAPAFRQPNEEQATLMARRVVIAEDEAIIRLDLKEILQGEGYDVVAETGRGDEAVDLVRTHEPDLVILDVKMPGIDGIEAARRIAASGQRVPVLILTAFSQRNLIEDARDAGVAAYLVKPFQRGELIPAIDVAVARFEELRAIEDETSAPGTLEDKLETRRLVDRAKAALMDDHGLSEADAFSFIQRTAMGRRIRMRQVAQEVLDQTVTP